MQTTFWCELLQDTTDTLGKEHGTTGHYQSLEKLQMEFDIQTPKPNEVETETANLRKPTVSVKRRDIRSIVKEIVKTVLPTITAEKGSNWAEIVSNGQKDRSAKLLPIYPELKGQDSSKSPKNLQDNPQPAKSTNKTLLVGSKYPSTSMPADFCTPEGARSPSTDILPV